MVPGGSILQFTDKDFHILPGDSAAGTFHEAWRMPRDQMFINIDNLSCGPLGSVEDREAWRRQRRDYWHSVMGSGFGGPKEDDNPALLYDRLSAGKTDLNSADAIFLWFGTTLQEQLLLAWVVTVFRHLGIGTEPLRLLEVKSHQPEFDRSIAILNSEHLKRMGFWRQPAEGEIASYETAWRAVSSHSPEDLVAFCRPDLMHPTPLKEALRAFMAHYPAVDTGLNYWDWIILAHCRKHGPMAARIIGYTMGHNLKYPDWSGGDIYLFDRLKRLGDSRLAHPPLTLTGNLSAMRFVEAAVNETGQKVLAGEANHVALNGIDDWVGGVHLQARSGSPWLFDGQTLVPGDTA